MMDFPVRVPQKVEPPKRLEKILGVRPIGTFLSRDLFVVLESEEMVRNLDPDLVEMKSLELVEGIIVTARGERYDFVSRCFYPKFGIDEDPVTGSAHCNLIPYWAKQLGKTIMTGAQLSRRGGLVQCELRGERVGVGGKARLYLAGNIMD
jgi:predicted PhzF superfamily epimerase YddE/YHI9